VKFGAFFKYAMSQGADYIATGHYARIVDGTLLRGVDEAKDQSYFLWAVPKEALRKTLFPLGDSHKDETRALAKKFNLPNATKRDSQGICFLGSISVEDFLRAEFGDNPGKAVDERGAEVGAHDGVLLHTIGERIALSSAQPGPWYVIRKDIAANTLVVGKTPTSRTASATFHLSETNWLVDGVPETVVHAQYRYHGPKVEGILSPDAKTFTASEPLGEMVAEGQSLVLYHGENCIGGGIISA
jgi:tRNA-specific 2-thiouridylase